MSDFKIYQINTEVYMLQDISVKDVLTAICNYVDTALATDATFLEFHNKQTYKAYSFSGFKEIEEDKIYKKRKIYSFSLRCIDQNLCNFLEDKLSQTSTSKMKGLITTVKIIPKGPIRTLYTITPAIIKLEKDGYWRGVLSHQEYEKRLFVNAVKKFRALTQEPLEEDFILCTDIRFLNRKPIAIHYKGVCFLGDKIELDIAHNPKAQKLAYMILGTGILENNARGQGFVNFVGKQKKVKDKSFQAEILTK